MSATERKPAPVQVTRRGAIAVVGADGHLGRHPSPRSGKTVRMSGASADKTTLEEAGTR